MKIAIVDDLSWDRDGLTYMLMLYLPQKGYEVEIFQYASGERFLEDFTRGKYAIIFLDICMDGMDGMETARRIREKDSSCLLIFISQSDAHAIEGYWVRAFHYLVKPYTLKELRPVLESCLKALKPDNYYIEVKEGRDKKKIRYRDIYYADMLGHYVQLHTPQGIVKSRMYFRDLAKLLTDPRFLGCYRNLIVNMDYIKIAEGGGFRMRTGEYIPIQRTGYKEIRRIYADYLFRKDMKNKRE